MKYKTRHDWVGKVIHWEFCKRLKFDYTNKLYVCKPESDFENERHIILGDYEIQTDYLIPAERPDLVLINNQKDLAIY